MRHLNMLVFGCIWMVLGMSLEGGAQETAKERTTVTEVALDRLQEEAKQAYYAADYAIALEKWQAGLDQARALEQVRAGLTEKDQKLSFMQNKLYVYDELIELLQDLHTQYPDNGYDRKALEIFERKQGRVFLEEIGQSGARRFAGLPEAITHRELDLETQLAQTRKQLIDERAKPFTEQHKEHVQHLEKLEKLLQAAQEILQTNIETGESVHSVLNNLFQELNLTNTYVCEDATNENFVPIRYKSETRHFPRFLNSTQNDIISTPRYAWSLWFYRFSGFLCA